MTLPAITTFEMRDGDPGDLVVVLVGPNGVRSARVPLPAVLRTGAPGVAVVAGEVDAPHALTYRFHTDDACGDDVFRTFVLRVAARQSGPDVLGGLLKRLIPY